MPLKSKTLKKKKTLNKRVIKKSYKKKVNKKKSYKKMSGGGDITIRICSSFEISTGIVSKATAQLKVSNNMTLYALREKYVTCLKESIVKELREISPPLTENTISDNIKRIFDVGPDSIPKLGFGIYKPDQKKINDQTDDNFPFKPIDDPSNFSFTDATSYKKLTLSSANINDNSILILTSFVRTTFQEKPASGGLFYASSGKKTFTKLEIKGFENITSTIPDEFKPLVC